MLTLCVGRSGRNQWEMWALLFLISRLSICISRQVQTNFEWRGQRLFLNAGEGLQSPLPLSMEGESGFENFAFLKDTSQLQAPEPGQIGYIASAGQNGAGGNEALPTGSMQLPLLPESTAVYPGNRNLLFINEMRWRGIPILLLVCPYLRFHELFFTRTYSAFSLVNINCRNDGDL